LHRVAGLHLIPDGGGLERLVGPVVKEPGVAPAVLDPAPHWLDLITLGIGDPADLDRPEATLGQVRRDRTDDLFGHAVALQAAVAIDVLAGRRYHVRRIADDRVESIDAGRFEPADEAVLDVRSEVQLRVE